MTARRTALVVGASRGIGLAITRQLLQDRSVETVYATYRRAKTAAGLLDTNADGLHTIEADVANARSLSDLAGQLRANGERPDLVVNCAGILHEQDMQPEKALRQCRKDALMRAFEVNSVGPLMLARAVIPLMPRRQPAHFAALSAMVGSIGDNRLGGWYAYRASKAALNQFMRTLAVECRRSHPQLCITAIHPGTTDTALSRPFQANVKPGKLYTPSQTAERVLRVVSAGQPEDSGRFVNWDGEPIPW
jgi:NAD(P)-dependent dehydrogenase (short-subunit alcohol dehydrogenase family)